ncbi:MAG: helix-turn-helix domain-containing protein [Candidatus Cloacimonetes bacterium]|jgi:excisionase family DNA binding protein|nr:helix-turn-helix domain-containing protein [Candidatus Cloacimonadota bacterium]
MATDQFIDLQEAAELLKLKPATVYQYVWLKKLPCYKPFGRKLYFRKDELIELLNNGRIASAEEIQTQAANYAMMGKKK